MEELKKCPFCGGEVDKLIDLEKAWRKCGRIVWYETENSNPLEGSDYDWGWKCSACAYIYPSDFDDPDNPPKNKYCPDCGIKIEQGMKHGY